MIDSTADGVSIGNDWFSFISNNTVYVYSFSGHLINSFDIAKPFVSMCAYEYLLVIVYLDSVPLFGC